MCEPVNPGGVATYGFIIYVEPRIEVSHGYGVAAVGYRGDYATNNVAEYLGAIEALKGLKDLEADRPILRGDSKLVVRQLRDEWRVKSPRLKPLYRTAKELVRELGAFLEWIPRERNVEADELSRIAFKEFVKVFLNEFREAYSKWLPTDKQVSLLRRFGIVVEPWMTRAEASKKIRDLLSGEKP